MSSLEVAVEAAAIAAMGALAPPAEAERESATGTVLRLFDQHHRGLLRYVLSLGLPLPDGEEITQETFLQLCQHLRLGRSRENLPGWIFRVGHNLALKRRRSHQRTRAYAEVPEQGAERAAGPEERAAMAERRGRLLAAVTGLRERDRRCLALRAEGLRYREIAHVLGISTGSVSNSLTRSVARLMRVCGE